MNEIENYVEILQKSLERKLNILKKMQNLEKKQNEFNEHNITAYLDEKENLLENLERLDDGFEAVYERVKDELKANKLLYKNEIKNMQDLIRQITDISVALKADEERLKSGFDNFCSNKKKEIKTFKLSQKTVSNYYKNMKNIHHEEQSYFLDKKK